MADSASSLNSGYYLGAHLEKYLGRHRCLQEDLGKWLCATFARRQDAETHSIYENLHQGSANLCLYLNNQVSGLLFVCHLPRYVSSTFLACTRLPVVGRQEGLLRAALYARQDRIHMVRKEAIRPLLPIERPHELFNECTETRKVRIAEQDLIAFTVDVCSPLTRDSHSRSLFISTPSSLHHSALFTPGFGHQHLDLSHPH